MGRECASRPRPKVVIGIVVAVIWLGVAATASARGQQVELSPTGSSPSITYDTRHDEFLVIWSGTDPAGAPAVMARRVHGTGAPLAEPFVVANERGLSPAVAYDRRAKQYLVVWGTGRQVRGQRLSSHGRPQGEPFVVTEHPFGSVADVALAYNARAERYLVVYAVNALTSFLAYVQQLDAVGTRLLPQDAMVSSGCAVSTAASEREPRWLVAVTEFCLLRQFPGRIVAIDVGVGAVGSSRMISRPGTGPGSAPGVAFARRRGEYLVAWWAPDARISQCPEPTCPGIPAVYGQRLSPDGTQVGADDFRISDGRPAPEPLWPTDVAVGYDRRARQYLVVWEDRVPDGTIEVLGQRLTATGAEVGRNDFPISAMAPLGARAARPVVAARTRRGGYLVAWQRADAGGIFARRIDRREAD